MKRCVAAFAGAALIVCSAAAAQPAGDVSSPMSPPPGVLSTTHTVHSQDAYGDRHDAASTTYRDSNGAVSRQSQSTTTRVAAPPPSITTTTTTSSQSTTGTPPK